MSDAQVSDMQEKVESLARAVKRHGGDAVEVSLWSKEFTVEGRDGAHRATCTVILLPHEPTFQASFAFPNMPGNEISFNIGDKNASQTVPAATVRFDDMDEAASWLIHFLETPLPPEGK